jgi:hypothetical protein
LLSTTSSQSKILDSIMPQSCTTWITGVGREKVSRLLKPPWALAAMNSGEEILWVTKVTTQAFLLTNKLRVLPKAGRTWSSSMNRWLSKRTVSRLKTINYALICLTSLK